MFAYCMRKSLTSQQQPSRPQQTSPSEGGRPGICFRIICMTKGCCAFPFSSLPPSFPAFHPYSLMAGVVLTEDPTWMTFTNYPVESAPSSDPWASIQHQRDSPAFCHIITANPLKVPTPSLFHTRAHSRMLMCDELQSKWLSPRQDGGMQSSVSHRKGGGERANHSEVWDRRLTCVCVLLCKREYPGSDCYFCTDTHMRCIGNW